MLKFYSLPEVTLDTFVSETIDVANPIMDDICLPPYKVPNDHNDYDPIMMAINSTKPKIVLEFGTAQGNLTANICNQIPEARIYTVNALDEEQTGGITTFNLTKEEIGRVYRKHGFEDRVVQIYKNTLDLDLSEYFQTQEIDFAIIDACHDVDYVINDFTIIEPFMNKDSMIFLHDTHPNMKDHLKGSYIACMNLRRKGFNIKHLKGTWWGVWCKKWQ